MKRNHALKSIQLFACLILVVLTTVNASAQSQMPNPIIYLVSQEPFELRGQQLIRYRYEVFNYTNYPDALFAPAPGLPPCGANTNSSRTWVDIFNQSGKRLNGFCAFSKAKDLDSLWFALPIDEIPPSWIYIELNDRQTSNKYKSNLADTTN